MSNINKHVKALLLILHDMQGFDEVDEETLARLKKLAKRIFIVLKEHKSDD